MGPTVNDRLKKTGYILGPRHAMGPALADQPAQATPAMPPGPPGNEGDAGQGAAQSPPNLRDAGSEPDSCGTCANFNQNHCDQFDVDLTPNLLCDAFKEGAGPDENENPSEASTEAPVQTA